MPTSHGTDTQNQGRSVTMELKQRELAFNQLLKTHTKITAKCHNQEVLINRIKKIIENSNVSELILKEINKFND